MFGKIVGIVCVAITAAEAVVCIRLANRAKNIIDATYEEITELEAETEE